MYTLTICLSAFLLFLVQPMISKMLLPFFGGGASVWITSLVFFQFVLLLGYGLTHMLVRRLGLKRHLLFTIVTLVASLLFMPLAAVTFNTGALPTGVSLFLMLLVSVGVPYFMLTTTSPTLQYWIANDKRAEASNPYIQYGVSNLGSMGGLLVYPFVIEPWLTNSAQSMLWTAMFVTYAALLSATLISYVRHNPPESRPVFDRIDLTGDVRAKWMFQAMVPSALLIVVTHYLTLDVVNLPLLWVAPLTLYLLTFVLCFLFPALSRPGMLRTLTGVVAILALVVVDQRNLDFEYKIAAALACLFLVTMIFHGDLERSKPHKQDLTDFYFQLSAGGCLGSLLAAVVAPFLFDTTFEFFVVLIVALYYVVASQMPLQRATLWLLRAGVTASILVSFVQRETGFFGETIYQARSFYSTYAVRESDTTPPVRRLVAGTHVHGEQFTGGDLEHEPIAYYHRESGVGELFALLEPRRIGALGLGIGSIVEYGRAGDHFDIYELDPVVIDIAMNWFTILPETSAQLEFFVGDGRVMLRNAPAGNYDFFVLDAFTSGSIPTHLVTVEAIQEIFDQMQSDGTVAYHISNHHVDLLPVLNAAASALSLHVLYSESIGNLSLNKYPATWVALTRDDATAARIRTLARWQPPPPRKVLWTDESSNIWSVLRWRN